ncbi:MAG: peptidylprolyl isomerase [Halofilum sp. (in: g-proteobacteria)]|nr:peptidylprolyl isomerase [Halofilum sp. (in: g-proteobacteria)]
MQIAPETVASIDYKLTDAEGQVLDTSEGREPLTYLHGAGNIIPGLESALEGQNPGDSVSVTVEPAEAYGDRDERLIQQVPMEAFEGVDQVEPGMRFQATDEQGQGRVVTVTEVKDDQVTVDANHPLAGQSLNFEVSVVDVRAATPEEIDHGHAHTGDEEDH